MKLTNSRAASRLLPIKRGKFPFSNKKGNNFCTICAHNFPYSVQRRVLCDKCALPFCKNEVHFQTKCALSEHHLTHPFSLRCNPATALKSINSKAVPKQTTHSFKVTSCTYIFQKVSQKFKKKNLLLSIHD